jgi:hypothetical protein
MSAHSFDTQQAVAALRRGLERAPTQFASGVGRLLRSAPEDGLDRLMRSPARQIVLGTIFWRIPHYFDPTRADGVRGSIFWRITGRPDGGSDTYQLEIADRRCRVSRATEGLEPRLTITVDGAELVRLATGGSDPIKAYFTGRVALSGNIMFAAKLPSLFRFSGASVAR